MTVVRRGVLVLNAGSSSLKYAVVDPDAGVETVRGHVDRIGSAEASVTQTGTGGSTDRRVDAASHDAALQVMTDLLHESGIGGRDLSAVGHRVVHGGARFTAPVVIDDEVLEAIDGLARLAPLHNPPAAAGIRSARSTYPDLPQVAVFDTAFFADLPPAASTYAIDRRIAAREDIRRYGMHGTSHRYVAGEAARFLGGDVARLDQIVLHLGNGASAAAIHRGRPADTSMGLTPLEGLVMGTRGGDLDPGVLLHLLRHVDGMDTDALEDLLHHRAGLQGLAGRHDFRDLLAAVDAGDEDAGLAYDVYCHRIRKYVGAYLAVLDGADVVTFTGGVGEHNARVRADSLAGLDRLGIEVDETRNAAELDGPRRISTDDSRVEVLVVPTDEELEIARQVTDLLG
jgi:acetate kinase